jgi:D-sedoheptulose 7-phosphate isomerase
MFANHEILGPSPYIHKWVCIQRLMGQMVQTKTNLYRGTSTMPSIFVNNLLHHIEAVKLLFKLDEAVSYAGAIAANTLLSGGKIMFCGNGGSAADSQHLAAELTGRFIKDRRPLAAMALSTDTSALTCIGNDYSFDEVFARQVAGLGRAGDLLVGISTSGNSKNVIRAVEEAQKLGITTLGLLGRDGGQLRNLCSHSIVVPHAVTAHIQECHILIGHTLCCLIEQELGFA